MAKKAVKKAVAAAEVVPEALVGLDIAGLNDLIQKAQSRIQSLMPPPIPREQRAADFKKTDFFKEFKKKVSAIKAEIKAALKEGKATFEATIRFSVSAEQSYSVEDGVYEGYGDLFEYEVNAGKVTGEGLTKAQKERLEEEVGNYVNGMCEDGVELFFPNLRENFQALDEKVSALNTELEAELNKADLNICDIHE